MSYSKRANIGWVIVTVVLIALAIFTVRANAQAVVGANCTISWTANTEADLGGYRVYGTAGALTKTLDVLKPATSTTCAALGVQAGGTIMIQVDAVDVVGNRSPKSVVVVTVQDITAPVQPTGVTVTANPS